MIQIRSKRIIDEYHGFSFSRSSMARDQKGKLYYPNNARFLPGKFGQAVLVEEGTTNLITKDFDEWNNNGYHLELIKNGDWDYTLKRTNDMNSFLSFDMPCTPNTTYCFSVEQLIESDMERISFYLQGVQSATRSNQPSIKSPGKYSLIFTTAENDTQLRLYIHCGQSGAAGQQARIRLPQLEKLPYPTSFIDGTRADEKLTIPIEVLNHNAFTFEMWIKQSIVTTSAFRHGNRLLDLGQGLWLWNFSPAWPDPGGFNRRIIADFGQDASGTRQYLDLISQTPFSTVNFEYFAITFDGATFRFYRNGVLWNSKTPSKINPFTQIVLSNAGWIIDDLRISSIARSDEEILAAYESNQPLPVDQYTTCKLSFDGPDGQRGTTIVTL